MLASADFSLVDINGSSVVVKLDEPKENNVVKRYEAYVKDGRPEQACIIKANEDPTCVHNKWPFSCTRLHCGLEGLCPWKQRLWGRPREFLQDFLRGGFLLGVPTYCHMLT